MNKQFNCANKYVPPHAEYLLLPWYDRGSLMSYIDALKCDQFQKDSQGHLERTKIVNFAIIHALARGEPVDRLSKKLFKSVHETDLKGYKDRDAIVSSAIHTKRKDLYLDKGLVVKHFRKKM